VMQWQGWRPEEGAEKTVRGKPCRVVVVYPGDPAPVQRKLSRFGRLTVLVLSIVVVALVGVFAWL
jgi:hypothetical protein